LRILFAVTVVLGVSAPTFSATTASFVDTRIHVAVDYQPLEPRQLAKPLGDLSIAESDLNAMDPNARETQQDVVASLTEEPSRDALAKGEAPAAAKADEESLPVTVAIERVCEALADAAVAQGLPVGFFARLIWQESRFDQWARSPAGARGVAQFMPPTAAEYGLRDPFDPIESVAASARFLRELREQFGNLGLAAAAYNAGGGRIRKWLSGQSAMPEETRNYVSIITGHPPQRWTVQKPLEISFALPQRAPCDGIEGLSREAGKEQHHVRLTELSVELIEEAEAARRAAKIAAARAARNKRYAAAKAAKARKQAVVKTVAKSRVKVRVAERRTGAGS
jgi:Transglycosylase SLT domain